MHAQLVHSVHKATSTLGTSNSQNLPRIQSTLYSAIETLQDINVTCNLVQTSCYYQIYQLGTGRHTQKAQACTRCLPIAKGT